MKKDKEILFEIYRQMYRAATPSADFDKLIEEAEINEWGQKVIRYMDYEIDNNTYEDIIKNVLKSYRVPVYRRKMFITSVALGCSPKTKQPW